MREFNLNPLHYVSLPGYSYGCWLMSSGIVYMKLYKVSRCSNYQKSIRYIGADNLYGPALMQNLPYKDFEFTNNTTFDNIKY